jgi:hypothetical protein
MTLEIVSAVSLGALLGACVGIWRTWAFARKLIHMGVNLDQWSDYCEATMQARGVPRVKRDNVMALRRDGTDDVAGERHQDRGEVLAAVAAAWGSAPSNRIRPSSITAETSAR